MYHIKLNLLIIHFLKYDKRFKFLTMKIFAPLYEGEIRSFFRPKQKNQISMSDAVK